MMNGLLLSWVLWAPFPSGSLRPPRLYKLEPLIGSPTTKTINKPILEREHDFIVPRSRNIWTDSICALVLVYRSTPRGK